MLQYTLNDWVEHQAQDPDLSLVIQWLRTQPDPPSRKDRVRQSEEVQILCVQWKRLRLISDILYRIPHTEQKPDRYQLVVPKKLRLEILHLIHDLPLTGHLGVFKTQGRVLSRYYWPHCTEDVSRWVSTCTACKKRGGHVPPNRSPLVKMLGRYTILSYRYRHIRYTQGDLPW